MHRESPVVVDPRQIPLHLVEKRDGKTYDHARDGHRLAAQHQRVFDVMKDGAWRTPTRLEVLTGDSWASISARLRDFRKPRFGGHGVDRRYVANGLYEYRLVVRAE